MILRIMLRPSHESFAWLSRNILSRLLVIDLRAGKFRTIPAIKYRPAVSGDLPNMRHSDRPKHRSLCRIVGGSSIALLWFLSGDLGATQCGAPTNPEPTT